MSYTGSLSSEAMGTAVGIGPLASSAGDSPTYADIGEITAVSFTGAKRSVLDPTNMKSGGIVEKLDTLLDNGQIKLTMNRVTTDAGQVALQAAFVAGGKYLFQVTEPAQATLNQSTGNTYTFSAIISEGANFDLDPTKLTTVSYTLDVSGAITFVAGTLNS